jgi:hypothetical protein
MLYLVFMMLFILLIAGVIVAYVAFPHRGERLPGVPWLGSVMSRAVDRMPTLDEDEEDALAARDFEGEHRFLV